MADRKKTRGFTLVELMLVVAIIGLLITLLVPAVTKATEIIITFKTKGIQREIAVGLEAFRNDFRCYPPSQPVAGKRPDGASNLVYYLRGPAGAGWGTTAGGLMPFGGRAQKSYGPYYEAEESRVVYFADNTVAGFTDAFDPVGLRDNLVVGRILYFRANPETGRFLWDDNKDPNQTDPTKQAFMGYMSALQAGNMYITTEAWKCPDSTHTNLYDKSGTCLNCGKILVPVLVPVTKRYLLVSPGFDRRYGLLYKSAQGIVPYTEGVTEATLPLDDIWYAR